MLTLGLGSCCDVCFERFGQDNKAPCSIACGHVFCVSCIGQVKTLCPLCRLPFDKQPCITLRVDFDVVSDEQSRGTPVESYEALRLQQAIASVADEGTTEPRLRQLIQECKTFLNGKPRHMHKELRVAHRMIAYLCEVRSTLRSTTHNLEVQTEELKQQAEEIQQLAAQKEELQKQLAEVEESHKYERESSQAVETNLRQHCEGVQMAYKSLVDMYNAVAKRNEHLSKQLEAASTTRSGDASLQPPAYSSILDKKIDRISLRGAALPDPDHPFLISPLPQFTTPLTTSTNFSFTPASVPPLPELTDDLEDDEEEDDSEPEHEATTPIVVHQDLRGSNGIRRLSFQQTTTGRSEQQYDSSALARTGPYLDHRRARSGSSPETYTSPSSSVKDTTTTTTTSNNASPRSRSPPKSATLSQTQQVQQHASSSRDSDASSSSSFPTRSNSTRNPDGGVLRTRLHDLLRDSGISSSLPNMSPASHFPTSFTNRETSSGRVSPLPPRSDSSNTNKSSSSSSSISDTALPLLPQTTGSSSGKPLTTGMTTSCNFAPRQGFSSASTEAKKLEEERRRKLIEEKQQQQQQHANDMMDRESHSSMSNKSSSSSSTSSTNQTSSNNTTSTSIQLTPRREQQPSATSPIPPSATTRRGQSYTGSLGRSGSSKEEQDTGPTSSSSTTTRRGQSFSGPLGRSAGSSIVSPSKEEHDSFAYNNHHHQTRPGLGNASTSSSISKARGGAILSSSVDPAGIYA